MNRLILDFETRAVVDIKTVGAWKYARHPKTEILCLGASLNGDKAQIFTGKQLQTKSPGFQIDDSTQIVAHHAAFEYAVYNYILHKRYGWPALWDPQRWDCTLSRAVMCGLPASLDQLGKALELPTQKDLTGRMAMLKLCKPIHPEPDPLGDYVFNDDPALYEILHKYCARDVETEVLVDKILPQMPPSERKIFELDLTMNCRGIQIDTKLARRASDLAAELTLNLNKKLQILTGGAVDSASRVAAIKRYLESLGIDSVEKLDKQAVDILLKDPDMSPHIKEVLSIRRQVGKSSTAKYKAAIATADDEDGRVRGALQYHAAHTGRWGGRLIQPQNYPQGLNQSKQKEAVDLILSSNGDGATMLDFIYGDKAMQTLSDVLRGMITAAPGKQLLVADYNAIEARVLFWEANDQNALAVYARGESPYVDMARYIYRNPNITKKDNPKEYDIGKRVILGCGYGMGHSKFKATCAQYGVEVSEELAQRAVKAYREKYRSVVNTWYAVEKAAVEAIRFPGSVHYCMGGRVAWGMSKNKQFLACKLPSGRFLRYYKPTVSSIMTPWNEEKPEMKYWAAGITGSLEQFKTYGGALVENITQAVARDIMAHGMLNCEAAGYPIVLTVHDEIVAEVSAPQPGENLVSAFIKQMCRTPIWAAGCPITAEGWIRERYGK